jgi:hypothetical protein
MLDMRDGLKDLMEAISANKEACILAAIVGFGFGFAFALAAIS